MELSEWSMSITEQVQCTWKVFHPDQIRARGGDIITAEVHVPFYGVVQEQWTIAQRYEDGSVLAYKPVRKPARET